MPGSFKVSVFEGQQVVFQREFTMPVELGRQSDGLEELYSCRKLLSGHWRAVIARLDEHTLSRRHALLEALDDGRVHLTNVSAKVTIHLPDGSELPAAGTRDLSLPADLHIGRRHVRLESNETVETPRSQLHSLPPSLLTPGQRSTTVTRFPTSLSVSDSIEIEELLRWLQTTVNVLQSAANSSDFFQKAADAVVEMVGLHSGRVLLRENSTWKTVAERRAPDRPLSLPSMHVLQRVVLDKSTFWQSQDLCSLEMTESLIDIEMVVAAPILDSAREVIGVLYGDCRCELRKPTRSIITKVEAMLVELLAGGVAAGLARIEQEKKMLEADVRFGQFFTKELSRQLALQPDLLNGRNSEVTIVFSDIRGFSRISERLGPAKTVEWLGDVMGELSDCVLAHRGVLVDYIGDEMLAMWGAPEEQPDHASLACRAALEMFTRLPHLNERWQERLGEPMALGIGVNSGVVHVGNMGSHHKFKYGPLGHHVNLASRVQGATKYLRAGLLITEFTRAGLGTEFHARRLCQVRVVNIEKPVNLYELVPDGTDGWLDLKTHYEQALEAYEQGRFGAAAKMLGMQLGQHPNDAPSLVLLSRAVNALVDEATKFNPVWDLPGK